MEMKLWNLVLLLLLGTVEASMSTKRNVYQPCTRQREGMVRYRSDRLEYCDNARWESYDPAIITMNTLRRGQVGHWPMDEQTGSQVADDSGYEHHATSSDALPALAKFSRGRYFNGREYHIITVPNSPFLNFGTSSFTVSGWIKIVNVAYPMTTFAVKKGHGCYFVPGKPGWKPGWETGHGYSATGTDVCIRDHLNNMARGRIVHDGGYQPHNLVNKWAHYIVIFDRKAQRVFLYIDGRLQRNSLDISRVKGSVNNNKNLELGLLYGWKTHGTLDDYRLFNFPLNREQAKQLYLDHRV